jgi:hypothetical protein
MAFYRIYCLDAAGHIASATDAVCADDAQAAVTARALLRDHPAIEIWGGTHLVGRVTAETEPIILRNGPDTKG